MNILNTEVTIVGAGPAGCFLSVLLARSGVKVLLLEQHKTFDREFRGNAFQPSVVKILDQMGLSSLLDSLDHEKVSSFTIRDRKGTLLTLPLQDLPKPYNYAFITSQPPLLKRLVEEAGRYPNFRFIADCPVNGVVLKEGAVSGVMAQFQNQPWLVKSRLVVAADGRFSAIRRDLGISLGQEQQSFDFVWFEMPRVTDWQHHLGLTLDDHGILINLPKERDTSQVGWVIPKGGFAKLRQEGMDKLYERVRRVSPELGEVLPQHLKRFDQCALLDVKIGEADTWTREGLLLIGDAAHIASPIGAQGNKLAIEDAVLAHPVIVDALKNSTGCVTEKLLEPYVTGRKPDIERMLCLQQLMGKMIVGPKRGIVRSLRRRLLKFLDGSFLKKKMLNQIALGSHPVEVATSRFDHKHNEDPAHIFHPLRVKRIISETGKTKTLDLEIPEHLKPYFEYKAGQFLTVRILAKGLLARRCYSLSSTPGVDDELSVTVKWIVNGRVSTLLVKELGEGDTLWVLPPRGSFIHKINTSGPRHHVLFAAGSGVVPLFSILKSILKSEPESRVTLVYGNHDKTSVIFKEALDEIVEREPDRFELNYVFERLNQSLIEDALSQFEDDSTSTREYYVCGPEGMMDEVIRVLKQRKIKSRSIHFEKFVSLYSEEEKGGGTLEPSGLEMGDPSDGTTVIPEKLKLKLNGKEHTVPIRKGETVLAATLRAGLPAAYSCESGVCATCTAKLKEGRVRMEHHDALEEQDIKRKNILTCQAVQMTREAFVDFDAL